MRGRNIQRTMAEMNVSAENLGKDNIGFENYYISDSNQIFYLFTAEVTNNGRQMNPSLSEDSVADTAISKRNSDGMLSFVNLCIISISNFTIQSNKII